MDEKNSSNLGQENNSQDIVELKPGDAAPVEEPKMEAESMTSMAPVQSQVDFGTSEEKKKSKGPIIAVVAVLIAVAAAVGIFVFGGAKKAYMSKPKNVFDSVINNLSKDLNTTIKSVHLGSSLYSGSIKIESNIDELKDFDGTTIGFRAGLDSKNKLAEGKLFYKDKSNKEISGEGYIKSDNMFLKLSSDSRLFKLGSLNDLGMGDLFDYVENVNTDDTVYLSEKITKLLLECFADSEFTKEDATITVNSKDVKVTRNTYVLNKDKIKKIFKHIGEGLYNDSKAMEIITSSDLSKDDFKKMIDEEDFSDIPDDFKVTFNLYTKDADVVGLDIEGITSGKIYYYSNDGEFDASIPDDNAPVTITGRKDGSKTNVVVKIQNQELLKLSISKWEENNIVFDYELDDGVEKITGSVDYKNNKNGEANDITFKGSISVEGQSLTLTLTFKEELDVKIADIDEGSAVEFTDQEAQTVLNNFVDSLKVTPLYDAIESMSQQTYDYNYDYDYGDDDWNWDDEDDTGLNISTDDSEEDW